LVGTIACELLIGGTIACESLGSSPADRTPTLLWPIRHQSIAENNTCVL